MNAIAQLRKDCERIGCICLADEPMAAHTSFKIGGPADLLLKPRDAETAARVGSCLFRSCLSARVPTC